MTDSEEFFARLALQGATLSGALALLLWRQGLMPDDVAVDFAEKLRDMARAFDEIGAEKHAAQLWTAANLLQKRPPTSRE